MIAETGGKQLPVGMWIAFKALACGAESKMS